MLSGQLIYYDAERSNSSFHNSENIQVSMFFSDAHSLEPYLKADCD